MKKEISRNNNVLELLGGSVKPRTGRFSWLTGGNEPKFSKAEIKHIRRVVEEQLNSSEPWINIDGIVFPKYGHIFRLKKNTRYSFIPPGSPVFVLEAEIEKDWFTDLQSEVVVRVLPFNQEGKFAETKPYQIRAQHLESISSEDVKVFLENREKTHAANQDLLFDGEAVELAEDIFFKAEVPMEGAFSNKFSRGLRGVIDNPNLRQGRSLDDINNPYQLRGKTTVVAEITLLSGNKIHRLQKDRFELPLAEGGDRYSVYVPSYRTNIDFTRSQLQRRSFDKKMFDRVVMDDQTRKDILSLVQWDEEILCQWGIKDAFQKGRGKIFLAFGPPGTGKTMTGEALAELLERPLYIADSTNLSYDSGAGVFEQKLCEIIERTERWNSVTLIDEAEVILQSRDMNPLHLSPRVAAVLRNLEKLERGILWLTTNRPPDIDFAIDSRIRGKIYFPELDAEKRRKVWQIIIPQNMPISDLTDSYLDELAKININGREIRNAIMNAADRAIYEGKNCIPVEYLLAAAKTIHKNQKILDEAKEDIGFLKGKKRF